MEWYLKVMKQYADFNGRARRKEYWMFLLFNIIFALVAMLVDNLLGMRINEQIPYGYLYLLYGLATFIPGIAVGVRRLHDVGKRMVVFNCFYSSYWRALLTLFIHSRWNSRKQ